MTSRYFCLGCDYDLTGLSSQVCPECGQTFVLGDDQTCYEAVYNRIPYASWAVGVAQLLVIAMVVLAVVSALLLAPSTDAESIIFAVISLAILFESLILIISINTLITQVPEVRSKKKRYAFFLTASPLFVIALITLAGMIAVML